MKLLDFLSPDRIEFSRKVKSKEDVLRTISSMVTGDPVIGSAKEDEIFKAFTQRESMGSTGFGQGVAIPHCRLPEASGFAVGILVAPKGVDFDSMDGEKARIFPFVVGPESETKEYLKILSSISQVLRREEIRKKILSLDSPQEVYQLIRDHILPDETEVQRRPGMKMIHVFIRDEDVFDDILQIFSSSDGISAMVLETHESTDYLMKGPFYAGFWDTNIRGFNRLIVAVVRNELVNSTVRSIEYFCGKLKDRDDILVTVTDLHYALGSLSN